MLTRTTSPTEPPADPAGAERSFGTVPPLPRTSGSQDDAPERHDATEVVTIIGDVDSETVATWSEPLWSALMTARSALVVDLTQVTFLGSAGLELLDAAHTYARHRGTPLGVVVPSNQVEQALLAGGLDRAGALYRSLPLALDGVSDRPVTTG